LSPLLSDPVAPLNQVARPVAAVERSRVNPRRQADEPERPLDPAGAFRNVIGTSAGMQRAVQLGCKVARHAATTVLVQGETGTGKELFARGVHYAGPQEGEPFVAVNCAAIPESLLESELFGHERGAFTGADHQKRGLLEFAGRGTVFLDEVSELPAGTQAKLLRVLEDRRVRRVGGLTEYDVRCRIIAATNRDLSAVVSRGGFREDLYYRLNVFRIDLPPLRERDDDVDLLARHFLDGLCRERGLAPKEFAPGALQALRAYTWPGNVRELRNTIERAIILAEGSRVLAEHMVIQQRSPAPALATDTANAAATIVVPPEGLSMADAERQLLAATLRLARDNHSLAAKMLGLSRPTILRKIRKYRLDTRG
jgi:two-component system response regulator AtoC